MSPELATFLQMPAVPALVGAGIGALGQWLVTRANKAPDVQTSLNAAVAGVIQHYEQALERATKEIGALRVEIEGLRKTVEEQSSIIEDLESHVDELTDAMTKSGVSPPSRPRRRAVTA
jgi:predicted RNase H-like nuclease (RuvC/YqgF family)